MKTVLKKGDFSAIDDKCVSPLQYIIVKEDNSKFLLLRLANNLSQQVDSIKLTIRQLDATSNVFNTLTLYCAVDGKPSSTFITERIELFDDCVDVSVELICASFEGKVFIASQKAYAREEKQKNRIVSGRKVSLLNARAPRALLLVLVVMMLLSGLAMYLQLQIFVSNSNTFFYMGVEYAFEGESKSPDAPIYAKSVESGASDIVIPSKIKNHMVTAIRPSAFEDAKSIRTVTIDAPIIIPQNAFYNCTNLTSVTLNGVIEVQQNAFANCASLVSFQATDLTTIRDIAFYNCTSLRLLKLSSTSKVLKIEAGAFSHCSAIETIDIGQYVDYSGNMPPFADSTNVSVLRLKNYNTSFILGGTEYFSSQAYTLSWLFEGAHLPFLSEVFIEYCGAFTEYFCHDLPLKTLTVANLENLTVGNYAFYNCSYLNELNVPFSFESVGDYSFSSTQIASFDARYLTIIGKYAFANCTKLSQFDLKDNVVLQDIGEGAFMECRKLESFFLPQKIETINALTFNSCTQLSKIEAGGIITTIKSSAFSLCSSLKSFPFDGVVSIGEMAFFRCDSLNALDFDEGLTTIQSYAFTDCTNLATVALPKSVTNVGIGTFYGCSSIVEMTLPYPGGSEDERYFSHLFDGHVNIPKLLQKITITQAKTIHENAFYGCSNIRELVVQSKLERIGANAFFNCIGLRKFTIPDTVNSIAANAFKNCFKLYEVYNLSSLLISCGGSSYGGVAFYALKVYQSLSQERMPHIVQNDIEFAQSESGKWYAIDYIGSQKSITFPHSVYYNGTQVGNYEIIKYMIIGDEHTEQITIGGSATTIADYAFDCSELKSVSIASEVQSIGRGAFFRSLKIEQMQLPFVGGSLVSDTYLAYIFDQKADNPIGIPQSLKKVSIAQASEISDYAFYGSIGLEELDLPDNYLSIGQYAFAQCSSLTSFEVPTRLESMGYCAFENCDSLTEVVLPFVGQNQGGYGGFSYAFRGTTAIRKVTLTQGQNIPDNAFYNCHTLVSVSLPNSITSIGVSAFESCYELNEIVLPAAVSDIQANAFAYCSALKVITLNSVITIGDNAFFGCWNLLEIYNLGGMNLTKQSTANGYIAYYAVAIYSSLSEAKMNEAFIDGLVFWYRDDEWIVVNYDGRSGDVNLGSFTYNGNLIESYQIASGAFSSSFALANITMGSEVKSIGERAFYDCYNLKSVKFVSSDISEIKYETFSYCTALKEVELPQKLTKIAENAFIGCYALNTITIPENVTEIGEQAFLYCEVLFDVVNHSNLAIQKGSSKHGSLGFYALRVISSKGATKLQTVTENDFTFMHYEDEWYMIDMPHEQSISLPQSISIGAMQINYYVVLERSFAYDSRSAVFIPLAVTKIQRTVDYTPYYISAIHYQGNEQQWKEITKDLSQYWQQDITIYYNRNGW